MLTGLWPLARSGGLSRGVPEIIHGVGPMDLILSRWSHSILTDGSAWESNAIPDTTPDEPGSKQPHPGTDSVHAARVARLRLTSRSIALAAIVTPRFCMILSISWGCEASMEDRE